MTDFEIIAEANHWFNADQAGWTNVLDFVKAIQPQLAAAPVAAPSQHRDLQGLQEFVDGFCMGDSRLIACAEAAWAKCMERNAAPVAK